MAEDQIPKSWDWYSEALKWFVAIAAALLAFGFERAASGLLTGWVWWMHLLGAGGLAASVVFGLYSYLQLLGAGNIRELKTDDKHLKAKGEVYRTRMVRAYQRCVGTLMLGVCLSSVAWVAAIWPGRELKSASPAAIELRDTVENPLVLRQRDGHVEILLQGSQGVEWQRVDVPEPKPSH